MSKNWHVGLRVMGWMVGVSLVVGAASAAELAAAGTKGTLYFTLKVEGEGRVDSEGGGWDYSEWTVSNTADAKVEMKAQPPTMNAEKFAGLGGQGAEDEDEGEDDEDWEEEWDDKLDACNGNESCEDRVEMQRIQDPRFRAMMGSAMATMGTMDLSDFGPTLQSWTYVIGTVTGRATVKRTRDTYGIVDTGGDDSLGETHCVTSGQSELTSKPSGFGDIGVALTINSEDSSYELTLPVEQLVVAVVQDCGQGTGNPAEESPLGGWAHDAQSWKDALKVKGLLSGSADQPALSGTKVWEGEWHEGERARVTMSWRFAP